jgi:hypothetical protein
MAVRGDEPLRIMQRAGHTDFRTTQLYIREAEAIRDGFGEVFPSLPMSLLGPGAAAALTLNRPAETSQEAQVCERIVPKVGVEPTLPFGETDFESAASAGSATSAFVCSGSRKESWVGEGVRDSPIGPPSPALADPALQATERAAAVRSLKGPVIASVSPSICRFTNSARPSGDMQTPANSPPLLALRATS